MKITVEDVLNSPVVAYPLLALDCCLMSVGAACGILADECTDGTISGVRLDPDPDPGDCGLTPTLPTTWGALKTVYR